ncbi:reticulon family protein isoform X2 [Tasmannia lanceolata]|uniref:reticulon family protein isoform X2 n=1 Tax=Tasmannia lanceolata TaxID=3420 RepID=UPI00406460F5
MQLGRRRTRNGVVAGSVWESRMKIDEVKGGIKVFNGGETREEGVYGRRLKRNQSDGVVEKRKTWKSEIEKSPIQLRKTRSDSRRVSDENCKEFGVCRDKMVSRSLSNVGLIRSIKVADDDDCAADDKEEEGEGEIEKETVDIKEMNLSEEKQREAVEKDKKVYQIHEKPISDVVDKKPPPIMIDYPVIDQDLTKLHPSKFVEKDKKVHLIHEKPISTVVHEKPPSIIIDHPAIDLDLNKPTPSKFAEKNKKVNQIQETPISAVVDKKPPRIVIDHPVIDLDLTKPTPITVAESTFESFPETQNRMQNIVDLVMWRDISKSAFVFGLGSFMMLSSSFAKDLNFSFISAISYLGLLYLATTFFYKSILCRGVIDFDDARQKFAVGEEEAIWLLKLILPYINELLLKLRGLFSGDPPTTMKLAIFLFVMARCGGSITIWKMAKLAFFGVFTVPKICSSYSAQLSGYGKFWVRRFQDAWDSCTHKKAVAAAIFTVIWNLSSVIARIFAAIFTERRGVV